MVGRGRDADGMARARARRAPFTDPLSIAVVTSITFSIDTTLRIGAVCYLFVAAHVMSGFRLPITIGKCGQRKS
jgi:hypothetical protein